MLTVIFFQHFEALISFSSIISVSVEKTSINLIVPIEVIYLFEDVIFLFFFKFYRCLGDVFFLASWDF